MNFIDVLSDTLGAWEKGYYECSHASFLTTILTAILRAHY